MKQKLDEFNSLLQIITSYNVKKTLEIGTFDGESALAFYNTTKGQVVTIDPWAKIPPSKNVILVSGFAQAPGTINAARSYGPYDFLFIDGDHRRPLQDFEIYSKMVKRGGIIAFHDINPNCNFATCPVVPVWNELKTQYRSLELISQTNLAKGYGIGVLFV